MVPYANNQYINKRHANLVSYPSEKEAGQKKLSALTNSMWIWSCGFLASSIDTTPSSTSFAECAWQELCCGSGGHISAVLTKTRNLLSTLPNLEVLDILFQVVHLRIRDIHGRMQLLILLIDLKHLNSRRVTPDSNSIL